MSHPKTENCAEEDIRVVREHNNRSDPGPTFYTQVFHGMRNSLTEEALEKNSSWDKKVASAVRTARTAIKLGIYHKYMSPLGLRAQQKRYVPNQVPLNLSNLPNPKY